VAFFTFNGHARWGHDAHAAHDDHGHDAHAAPAAAHGHDDHAAHGHDDHGHAHTPHESPWIMLVPLIVLSIGSILAGYMFHHQFIGAEQHEFWRGAIFNGPTNHVMEHHEAPQWVVLAPLVASVLGLLVAAYMYLLKEGLGARLAARKGPLYTFFYNKWFFDELYNATFVRAAKWLGDVFWKVGDQKIIDGLGPNGVSAASYALGRRAGLFQSGYVYHYAFVMLLGVAGLLSYALWAWAA
jgi:NADH-quinone oxidoreductase subunit L